MLLENMTYQQVEKYLERQQTILLPTGSVEQHSPYGILGTDFIAAEGIAREVGDKMGLLVAPAVSYGVSPHHMRFKGTATLSPLTYIRVLVELCESFVQHGFRRIFLINGHGGNKNAAETAFQELKMNNIPGQFSLIAWYEGLKETEMLEELFQGQDGSHATPSEISLTMVLRPDVFAGGTTESAPPERGAEENGYYWPLSADEMSKTFPDGRMGAASWLASAEKGQLIRRLAVETTIEKIEELSSIALL